MGGVLLWVLVPTVVGALGGVGWLFHQGRLSDSKLLTLQARQAKMLHEISSLAHQRPSREQRTSCGS